jgi:hypothetical protein
LETARADLAAAQADRRKADQAVADTQKRMDDLTALSDGVVVDAFLNPPADTALDAMTAESMADASLKASIVGLQHDADASILSALLGAASSAGLNMCGGGYRDPAQQIALRQAHCGSSSYAIYQAPSSACPPPTARPGTSMHERGLAVDFTCGGATISQGSACFGWLQNQAASYGVYNLPSEPWHWSTNGQ